MSFKISMRPNKNSIIPWGCVFKITFPNSKIYIGSDTASTAKLDFFRYFGSPQKAREEMLADLGNYIKLCEPYVLRKEILYSAENCRIGDILKIEQQFIKDFGSKNPSIGYNR